MVYRSIKTVPSHNPNPPILSAVSSFYSGPSVGDSAVFSITSQTRGGGHSLVVFFLLWVFLHNRTYVQVWVLVSSIFGSTWLCQKCFVRHKKLIINHRHQLQKAKLCRCNHSWSSLAVFLNRLYQVYNPSDDSLLQRSIYRLALILLSFIFPFMVMVWTDCILSDI